MSKLNLVSNMLVFSDTDCVMTSFNAQGQVCGMMNLSRYLSICMKSGLDKIYTYIHTCIYIYINTMSRRDLLFNWTLLRQLVWTVGCN